MAQRMKQVKEFATRAKSTNESATFKVVVLFNSVSDSLPPHITLLQLQKFQLQLTLEFEFDYLEVYTPLEVVEFLKEMHLSILDKPHRKELSIYSRKGQRPSNKARIAGMTKDLELTYVSLLITIPGLSENKAIAIAKAYPTLN
jgi:hypothetical protein